ncbi:MAG TPA: hypothetical protein PKB15_05625, partial [Acidimicrobiia bacterium]|nr:hypothetical protein [Acidimicrobiia bacterium]
TYLSGLDSAKKSVSKSTLRTAITIVQGVQAGAGSEDFSGIGTDLPDAVSKLNLTEPDFTFVEGTLTGDNKTNDVGVIDFETNQIVMQTRDGSGHCYFVQYNLGSSTKYGSDTNAGGACPSDPSGGVEYTKNQSVGWKAE